jgi:hypothetical protein
VTNKPYAHPALALVVLAVAASIACVTPVGAAPPPAPAPPGQPSGGLVYNGTPLQKMDGDNQSVLLAGTGKLGVAVFAPVRVAAFGSNGRPLPNVPVAFSCAAPTVDTCSIGTSANSVNIMTNEAGLAGPIVSVTGFDGPVTVTAKYGPSIVTFNLKVMPPAVSGHITLSSGGNQKILVGTSFAPVVVNYSGSTAGAKVAFTCTPNCTVGTSIGTIAGSASTRTTVGVPAAGSYTVTGTLIGGVGEPVSTTLTAANPRPPLTVSIVSGNSQTVARGSDSAATAIFAPLSVVVKDSQGFAIAQQWVQFICGTPTNACSLTGPGNPSDIEMTNSDGIATASDVKTFFFTGTFPVTAKAIGSANNASWSSGGYASGTTAFSLTSK